MKDAVISFFREEEGMETVEMVIILVVLVGIAFAFRKTLTNWYNGFLADAQNQGNKNAGVPNTGTKF